MDVFDLDRSLVADYQNFARSFTQIRAQDIRDQVDKVYARRRFWPEPLITVNPHFERGASVEALVADGSLHPDVARIFQVDGQSITLYRHQMLAVAKDGDTADRLMVDEKQQRDDRRGKNDDSDCTHQKLRAP